MDVGGGFLFLTSNNSLSTTQAQQHVLNQPHVRTSLKITHTFAQDCDEYTPNLSLKHAIKATI
jgi:hypothetical protein